MRRSAMLAALQGVEGEGVPGEGVPALMALRLVGLSKKALAAP